ncbi:MAG: type I restriction enzyme HsdR N-terminal domain-containing protein [Bacteroidia bacterium]|nr:type I restriction enzyme HsdR N-terminal domain-containing protein [Bacteroidia bacterium]
MLIYPIYPIKTRKNKDNSTEVFDVIRKQWVILTPEEFVRQHFIHYLMNEKSFPKETIIVEKEINVFNVKKRFDVAVINKFQEILLLAEIKAPTVKLDQKVIDQILTYNTSLQSRHLVITNGLEQWVFEKVDEKWVMIKDIKPFKQC